MLPDALFDAAVLSAFNSSSFLVTVMVIVAIIVIVTVTVIIILIEISRHAAQVPV